MVILLTQGQEATVDETFNGSQFRWYFSTHGYAMREYKDKGKRKRQLMHRFIMNAKPGEIVDHINGNRLDNRRSNLRIVTRTQSNQNRGPDRTSRSGYRGVYWSVPGKKWMARVEGGGVCRHLGMFTDKVEAARAYNKVALELYGPYARLNDV